VTDEKYNPESGQDPEITKLYRASRTEEPSPALDERILEQARLTARQHRRRWLVPLSSAAVVLLGLTLTLKLMELEPDLFDINDYLSNEAPKSKAIEPSVPKKEQLEKKQKAAHPALQAPAPLMKGEDTLRSREIAPAENDATPAVSGSSVPERMMEEASPTRMMEEPVVSPSINGAAPAEAPEEWLARIMHLNEQGDTQTAIEEMARFRQHYPEYPVPDTLKKLLPKP
jgi:hypothetical protein